MRKTLKEVSKLIKLFLEHLKFGNETIENGYHETQKQLDNKLYPVLWLVTIGGVVLSGIFIMVFTEHEIVDYVFISTQLALLFLSIIIRRKFPALSKIVLLGALPLCFTRYYKLILTVFSGNNPAKFYAFGICVGIGQTTISTNFRDLRHKVFLMMGLTIVDICANEDGFIQFVNFTGMLSVLGMVLLSFVYQEILVRKDYKAVYESQEKLQKFKNLLSDDFPIGVLIVSAEELSIMYSNQFFNKNFEEDQLKIKSSTFQKFELEVDPSEVGFTFNSIGDGPFYFSEFIQDMRFNALMLKNENMLVLPAIYRDSGSEDISHYEIKIRSITWDQVPAYAIIFNDVSEKQLVTALKLADQQKDRIIATVSHELRTPINGTLGLIDMVSARTTDTLSQTYLNYCRSCNKLLLYLVNSILDLSQLNQDKFSLTQTRFLLDELLDEVKSLYLFQCQDKSIEFRIEKDIAVPSEMYTDRHRLIQVLINLITNAIKFTFHGSVTLRIERDPENSWRLKFSVIDTGVGIKEEDRLRLFQRFGKIPQADANINTQGVGLGLAIVQELVVALNYGLISENIKVESEYERGSTFSFCVPWKENRLIKFASKINESPLFPKEQDTSWDSIDLKLKRYDLSSCNNSAHNILLSTSKSPVAKQVEVEYQAKVKSKKVQNVLIVDDNPFNILAASFVLEKLNCSVDKAFHGQDCINVLESRTEKEKYYDLILMDIQMPIMDGIQASKIITEKIELGELRRVPIVALTAKQSTDEEKKYYEDCGVLAVLEKPLNIEKLIKTIESLGLSFR